MFQWTTTPVEVRATEIRTRGMLKVNFPCESEDKVELMGRNEASYLMQDRKGLGVVWKSHPGPPPRAAVVARPRCLAVCVGLRFTKLHAIY